MPVMLRGGERHQNLDVRTPAVIQLSLGSTLRLNSPTKDVLIPHSPTTLPLSSSFFSPLRAVSLPPQTYRQTDSSSSPHIHSSALTGFSS